MAGREKHGIGLGERLARAFKPSHRRAQQAERLEAKEAERKKAMAAGFGFLSEFAIHVGNVSIGAAEAQLFAQRSDVSPQIKLTYTREEITQAKEALTQLYVHRSEHEKTANPNPLDYDQLGVAQAFLDGVLHGQNYDANTTLLTDAFRETTSRPVAHEHSALQTLFSRFGDSTQNGYDARIRRIYSHPDRLQDALVNSTYVFLQDDGTKIVAENLTRLPHPFIENWELNHETLPQRLDKLDAHANEIADIFQHGALFVLGDEQWIKPQKALTLGEARKIATTPQQMQRFFEYLGRHDISTLAAFEQDNTLLQEALQYAGLPLDSVNGFMDEKRSAVVALAPQAETNLYRTENGTFSLVGAERQFAHGVEAQTLLFHALTKRADNIIGLQQAFFSRSRQSNVSAGETLYSLYDQPMVEGSSLTRPTVREIRNNEAGSIHINLVGKAFVDIMLDTITASRGR